MFKPLLKYTFLTLIWKKYRNVIVSSLLLLFAIMVIVIIHNDYVRYSEKTGEQASLAASFLLKWCLILGAIALYIVYVKIILRVKPKPNKAAKSEPQVESADAFSEIRKKGKLSSKADRIIDK